MIIGFFSNVIFLPSCDKRIEYLYFETFTYNNQSTFDIKISAFTNIYEAKYFIKNNDSLVQRITLNNGGGLYTDGYISSADSITITFNDEIISMFSILDTSRFNIIRSSELIKREKNESFYRYTFTIDDYNYAGAK